ALEHLRDRRGDKRVLRLEVRVEAAVREPCPLHDLRDAHAEWAMHADLLGSLGQDALARLVFVVGLVSHALYDGHHIMHRQERPQCSSTLVRWRRATAIAWASRTRSETRACWPSLGNNASQIPYTTRITTSSSGQSGYSARIFALRSTCFLNATPRMERGSTP